MTIAVDSNELPFLEEAEVIVESFQNATIVLPEIIIDGNELIEDLSLIIQIKNILDEDKSSTKKTKKSG